MHDQKKKGGGGGLDLTADDYQCFLLMLWGLNVVIGSGLRYNPEVHFRMEAVVEFLTAIVSTFFMVTGLRLFIDTLRYDELREMYMYYFYSWTPIM